MADKPKPEPPDDHRDPYFDGEDSSADYLGGSLDGTIKTPRSKPAEPAA